MHAIVAYFRYCMRRKRWAHSPFVYDFIVSVLRNEDVMPRWKRIENARNQLKHSYKMLNVLDLGASGRVHGMVSMRKISSIVRTSCKSERMCRLLARMVRYYKCERIVEFGTSFGMSTAYLASACQQGKVYTVEGSPEVLQVATQVFEFAKLTNIKAVNADFDYVMEHFADKMEGVDFFFLDGNHAYEPTMRYFKFAKQYAGNNTIFVFDDIHWSSGMSRAWQEIAADTDVTVSIDLYNMGIVFFRKENAKQHFVLKQ